MSVISIISTIWLFKIVYNYNKILTLNKFRLYAKSAELQLVMQSKNRQLYQTLSSDQSDQVMLQNPKILYEDNAL